MFNLQSFIFSVPDERKQGLTDSEYKEYGRYFTRNHVTMLAAIIESSTNNRITVIKFILENLKTLFNIEKMIRDWWEDLECSNYKKRCILAATLREGQEKPPEDITHTGDIQPKVLLLYVSCSMLYFSSAGNARASCNLIQDALAMILK